VIRISRGLAMDVLFGINQCSSSNQTPNRAEPHPEKQ